VDRRRCRLHGVARYVLQRQMDAADVDRLPGVPVTADQSKGVQKERRHPRAVRRPRCLCDTSPVERVVLDLWITSASQLTMAVVRLAESCTVDPVDQHM